MRQLGLQPLLNKHPLALSGGEQQRVVIANVLMSDKNTLIFNEPTSGLDYHHMKHFATLLKTLVSKEQLIIVITHDQELIHLACDYHINLADYLT